MADIILIRKGGPGSGRYPAGSGEKNEEKTKPTNEQIKSIIYWANSKYENVYFMKQLDKGIREDIENGMFADDKNQVQKLIRVSDGLNSYIEENSGKGEPRQLFRGASHSQEFIDKIKPGDEFTFGSKISFSQDFGIAHAFSQSRPIGSKAVIYQVTSNRGVDISEFVKGVYAGDEKESIFPKNSVFRIKSVEKKAGKVFIDLEDK
jgi:hypothetical protein